jgi:hypothetical protein
LKGRDLFFDEWVAEGASLGDAMFVQLLRELG